MKNFKHAMLILACLLALTGTAKANENESLLSIIPSYMEMPVNGRYSDDINASRALGASKTGYTMGALSLAFGIENIIFSILEVNGYGCFFSPEVFVTFALNSANFLRTAITVPIVYHYANKTNAWNLYSEHKTVDAMIWIFYGLALALNGANIAGGFMLYGENLVLGIMGPTTAMLCTVASLALVATKAKLSYKMAGIVKKINNGNENTVSDSSQSLMIMPSMAPYVSSNNKISGGTIGVSMVF